MASSGKVTAAIIATVTVLATTVGMLYYRRYNSESAQDMNAVIRKQLPYSRKQWRTPGKVTVEDNEDIWVNMDPILNKYGLQQWTHVGGEVLLTPEHDWLADLHTLVPVVGPAVGQTPNIRFARTREGHDVVVRIITVNGEGDDHLKIMRKVATGACTLLSNNHCLPMLSVAEFEDITLGVFPLAGSVLEEAFDRWPKNSVGDILDMILQALEGLAFLHDQHIAHRDADKSNFVVQWHPESLRTGIVSVSRPHVYIIDFDASVMFSEESLPEERVCIGSPEDWLRPLPPEVKSGMPYSPFKLDVWQFGFSFNGLNILKTNIPAVDEMFVEWVSDDPINRPSASEALAKLSKFVSSTPPESLLIEPIMMEDLRYSVLPVRSTAEGE